MKAPMCVLAVLLACTPALSPAPLAAEQAGADPAAVPSSEIERMFDAYALVQAQDQLKLKDDQYTQFLPRFKALQDVRRRNQAERGRLLQQLSRLLLDAKAGDALLKDHLRALQDLDVRAASEIRRAFDAVDQVLDVRQQAQFRAFEEWMEQRTLDLVTRARQNFRSSGRGVKSPP